MIAATSTTVPATSTENRGVPVESVPADGATRGWRASSPASASTAMIGRNRPSSIATPSVVWKNPLVTVRPPNAEPLLFAADA